MAGELREWADIDNEWLKEYLEENRLASEFDLDDEFVGSQVSWVLNDEDWSRLRNAWDKHRPPEETQNSDSAPSSEPEASTSAPHTEEQTAPQNHRAAALIDDRDAAEVQRLSGLVERALGDWDSFKKLFSDCADSESLASWESLAASPADLLGEAERLIQTERAKADEQQRRQAESFEEDVNRAQNIVAGYLLYCRKSRISPTLEHMLVHIPNMRTGYSAEVVKEAWTRQAARSR